jgi:hypothetical protein
MKTSRTAIYYENNEDPYLGMQAEEYTSHKGVFIVSFSWPLSEDLELLSSFDRASYVKTGRINRYGQECYYISRDIWWNRGHITKTELGNVSYTSRHKVVIETTQYVELLWF